MTVRTDNLFIAHYQGSLLEEFHYYPFGMCFEVSKSPTLGKSAAIKYNSQLHDHDEFEDANGNVYGLEDYNFAFRNYDAQIGRWLQPDPLMQHPSPYLAMSNNPVSFTDPSGLWDGNPILDRNGYPIAGLFSTDGAYYQVDWSLTVSNGHNVGNTAFYVSEMDEYNYKIKSLNKYFSPLYDKYYHTMYANGNLRRNGEAYGEVAARYFDNQLAWGMSLKEGGKLKGGWDINSASFQNTTLTTSAINTQAQIVESSASLAKNDVARGLKASYSSMKSQINTLNKIGNVAKYGGAATSLLSVGLSYLKYQSTGNITASDGIGLLSASVAVTAVFFGGPVIVGSGLLLGAIQLVGGEYTDTITIYNRGNVNPPNRK